MKRISTLAVVAALTVGGAAGGAPAFAQAAKADASAQAAPARKFNFTKSATKSLQELQTAANAGDTAKFPAALAAAQAAAKNSDDRYFIAQMQLTYAVKMNDEAGKMAAVDAIIASGGAQPDELQRLYRAQADIALKGKNDAKALAAYRKVLEFAPGDAAVLNNTILLLRQQKNHSEAVALARQGISASKASGQRAPESLYRLALQSALDANLKSEQGVLAREFLTAYPTRANWQIALDIYRQSAGSDEDALLDAFRLMRQAKTLERPQEYMTLADVLARGRFYREAREVVNEGVSAGKFTATNASAAALLSEVSPRITSDKAALAGLEGRARSGANGQFALKLADGYYGHGDYTKAAEFYRLALQKGSVNAPLANTRLGMSLAQSGDRAGAEAAFKAVTGPRAELASLWMLWMSQRS
jgi:hypothetical protein